MISGQMFQISKAGENGLVFLWLLFHNMAAVLQKNRFPILLWEPCCGLVF